MKVWVDCTAAAHPVVLRPIINELEAQGHEVFITARDNGETFGNLDRLGMPFVKVSKHGGATRRGKVLALAVRSTRLLPIVWKQQPQLVIAHGSVDAAVVSSICRFPLVQMQDYEFATWQRKIAFKKARRVLVPDSIPVERLARIGAGPEKLEQFPGLKEDYFLAGFEPDPAVLGELGVDREKVLVVMRPPPVESEYHAPNEIYEATLQRLAGADGVQVVVVPRTSKQRQAARAIGATNLIVTEQAIDGQSLVAHADLVISAGGTMNREAVALGTPVFTTFTGDMGGVDEQLIKEDRLQVLTDPTSLPLHKRTSPVGVLHPRDPKLLVKAALAAT
ncbi:MAG TPA: DUF354 domain-containing protein [Solirubrobacterales bacterium]|nr:DUF354 domain-containing protein [Solirubrobacterales bacterium]